MRALGLTLLLFFSASGFADETDAIEAHTVVSIQSYDSHLRVFKVAIKHEATGPNYTTLKFLQEAIESLREEKRLKQKPTLIIGNEYALDHELKLLDQMKIDSKYKGKP